VVVIVLLLFTPTQDIQIAEFEGNQALQILSIRVYLTQQLML